MVKKKTMDPLYIKGWKIKLANNNAYMAKQLYYPKLQSKITTGNRNFHNYVYVCKTASEAMHDNLLTPFL